jgi:hypothetical protein
LIRRSGRILAENVTLTLVIHAEVETVSYREPIFKFPIGTGHVRVQPKGNGSHGTESSLKLKRILDFEVFTVDFPGSQPDCTESTILPIMGMR